MEDSYAFDDSYALIDETDIGSSSIEDSVQGSLVTQNEEPFGDSLLKERPEMSRARKLWYTARSLVRWKEKARLKQKKNRFLEKKVRDLSQSRDYWKNKAFEAEKQLKAHAASTGQAVETKASSKQTIISNRE